MIKKTFSKHYYELLEWARIFRGCIKKCFKSNLQELGINFWDNKSNDNSEKILKVLRIKELSIILQKRTVLHKARNLAIKKKGKIYCFFRRR